MLLHHFHFPYDRAVRVTAEQLDAVVDHCRAQGYRRIGVYGLGEAGLALIARLDREADLDAAACFDQRHDVVAGQTPGRTVLPPEALATAGPLDCLVNTVPPTYLVDVAETVAALAPGLPLLSLYDPWRYLDEAPDYPYKLYLQLSRPVAGPPEVAALARAMRDRLRRAIARAHEAKSPPPGPLAAAWDAVVAAEGRSLGQHLESRLRQCLEAPDGQRAPALLALAEAFPFFVVARDAAACLLVQAGDHAGAAAAFLPALDEYPCCPRTRAKAAELLLLAGDADGAARTSRQALALGASADGPLAPDDRPAVLAKWRRRRVSPPLEKRDAVKLRITAPVWGAPYLDLFMGATVPSLLASGNIPQAAARHDVCFTLYTRRADRGRVEAYPAWRELASLVPAEIVAVEEVAAAPGFEAGKYGSMSLYQADALRRSREEGRFTFLTLGDFLFSDRFLERALDYVLDGCDTVFFHSTRFRHDELMARVAARHIRGNRIEISAAELMAQALPLLHQSQVNYLRRTDLPHVPNTYYAEGAGGALIAHVFSRTPLLLAPLAENLRSLVGLDVDLPYAATDGGLGRYALVGDTGELAFVELTPSEAETATHAPGEPDDRACARWLRDNTDPLSRYFGAHAFVYAPQPGPAAFSAALAARINRLLA
ncbi:hypothetical protein [Solidesulfovibrio carbinolicus]|uniref:Uncharacterized protein n=1 Tax=Solidesulfovibrio carbinolicus TaxID=296842 RepID=A0A4P6HRW7_9BACT|nr:hypothetical protein [Solidesulfovibrio carbinolicus]QAZ69616.1 hypothetical protein C3Y92_20305 [Solidesulfovibrio carbinolicus]